MLNQVATLELSSGPALISRYDRARNVNFEIELSGMPLGEVTHAASQLPSLNALPPGVRQTTVGDAEVMEELFASFGLAMLTGVLCIAFRLDPTAAAWGGGSRIYQSPRTIDRSRR